MMLIKLHVFQLICIDAVFKLSYLTNVLFKLCYQYKVHVLLLKPNVHKNDTRMISTFISYIWGYNLEGYNRQYVNMG